MSVLDLAVQASLKELSIEPSADETSVRGEMLFGDELRGPPGRVHGGFHPLVRTLPILRALRSEEAKLERLRVDAALLAGLPLGEPVGFEGTYRKEGAGFVLETRFLGTDRLKSVASIPSAGGLVGSEILERFRALYEQRLDETVETIRVMGVLYELRPSSVILDLGDPEVVDETAHLRNAFDAEGRIGFAALSTQLDAVGAIARGTLMRHPHFTKHLELGFDLAGLSPGLEVVMIADRTNVVEDEASEKVLVRGVPYGSARVEVIAVDRDFTRCFGHGFITSHPVDPARFAGFESMRKLRHD